MVAGGVFAVIVMGTANGHDVFNNVLFLIALAVVCLGALSMVASPIHWAAECAHLVWPHF